ncbi:MAG: hypothetical protein P8101_05830 [Candidatus Thiodiazotropha sp.]
MNQRLAQWVFLGFNLLALPAVAFSLFELFRIIVQVFHGTPLIIYDSGDFSFILMSVFWVMWLIQYAGLKGHMNWVAKKAQPLLIGWFIGCLMFATLIPLGLGYLLPHAGYQKCELPEELGRLMPGGETRFSLTNCQAGAIRLNNRLLRR